MKKLLLAAAAATALFTTLPAQATAPLMCASIGPNDGFTNLTLCTAPDGSVTRLGQFRGNTRSTKPAVVTVVRSWDNTGINDSGRSACHYSNRGSLENYISQGYKLVATERIPFMGYGCSGVKYILSR